ncbi:unnamed protein product [Lactuca virosa]|uniref:Uncharacterized protein n=1 Tax=Lactuca virosa TaxID=75947 RepID=A0AAU9NRI3_9ASTR|nr:unnamed protein product [Lactuca virosa]
MVEDNHPVDTDFSTLTQGLSDEIIKSFHSDRQFKPILPSMDQPVNISPEGYVGVYTVFFSSGLRLPSFEFLNSILGFVFILFHQFYVTMTSGDWVSFSLRSGAIKICDGLPTSIKKWNTEFFFVDASAFGVVMQFESLLNRDHEPNPELTVDNQYTVDRLVANSIKWSDHDDSILEIVGQSNTLLERLLRKCNTHIPRLLRGLP